MKDGVRLDAKQLRVTKPSEVDLKNLKRRPIYFVLDNVLDTYNIGSIYRLADAVGVQEIILCEGTERPPSHRIHKAAVGTEEWVNWTYVERSVEAIKKLRERVPGIKVIAIEQDPRADSIFNVQSLMFKNPIAFVVGHETTGVSKEVLDVVDEIVEIPMYGINKSLNVHVSLAVVTYKILDPLDTRIN